MTPCLWTLLLSAAVTVPPGDQPPGPPLAQIPADAAVVLHLHGVQRTKDRLAKTAKAAVPDLASQAEGFVDQVLDKGLQGRKVQGLAAEGPIFFVVLTLPTPGQADAVAEDFAVVARVNDAKAFKEGLLTEEERKALKQESGFEHASIEGRELYLVERPGYVVLALSAAAAEKFTKPQSSSLDGKLAKPLAERFLGSDLSAYVDLAAVHKTYEEQISMGRGMMDQGFDQALEASGLPKGLMAMVKTVMAAMFQGFEDSQSVVAGVDFEADGASLRAVVQVAAESKTGAFLKGTAVGPDGGLAELPAGLTAYQSYLFGGLPFEKLAPLIQGMMGDAETEEGKALAAAAQELGRLGVASYVTAQRSAADGLIVYHFDGKQSDAPNRAAAAMLKMYRAFKPGSKFAFMVAVKDASVKDNAQEHRGFKLHQVTLAWDFNKTAADLPGPAADAMVESFKRTLGEGLNAWLGSDGKVTVQVMAKDWSAAQKLLDAYLDKKSMAGQSAAYRATRDRLPREATVISLQDTAAALAQAGGPFAALAPKPGEDGERAYLGVAIMLKPGTVGMDLWVPAKFVAEVRKMIQGAMGGP